MIKNKTHLYYYPINDQKGYWLLDKTVPKINKLIDILLCEGGKIYVPNSSNKINILIKETKIAKFQFVEPNDQIFEKETPKIDFEY